MEHDVTPWDEYWVLEVTETHKVKRIMVNPGGRLSLQYHRHRSDLWTFISGCGIVTIDNEVKEFGKGSVAQIPQGVQQRVEIELWSQ